MSQFVFEQLESRLLLAAGVTLKNNGMLIIKGDMGDDVVELAGTGIQGEVSVGRDTDGDGTIDTTQSFTGIKHITVRGLKGNDTVTVDSVNIAGNLRIFGNQGDDQASMANSTIGGRTIINGAQGNDTFEDLGGNTFGKPLKLNKVENQGPVIPPGPPNPLDLGNDAYAIGDNIVLNVNVTGNDTFDGLPLGMNAFVTSIASGGNTDSEYDTEGNLTLSLANGTLKVNSFGQIEYDPNDIAVGQKVTDTFTYTITDIGGNTATATVSISVDGNGSHLPTDDLLAGAEIGADQQFNLFGNDDFAVPGQITFFGLGVGGDTTSVTPFLAPGAVMTLTASSSIHNLNQGDIIGTISVDAAGQLTFNPDANLVNGLDDGDELVVELRYGVNNGLYFNNDPAADSTATITLTITGAAPNEAPEADDDTFGVSADDTVSDDLLANDSDPENDALTVTEINGTIVTDGEVVALPSGASLTINADGTFTYDPNGVFESLADGETDIDTFTYTIDDGNGGTDTATATVTITGVNDAPTAEDDTAAVDEHDTVNGDLFTNDSDPDTSDVLSVTEIDGNSVTDGEVVSLASGALLTINADGTFTYDPNGAFEVLAAGETDTDTFTYTIDDGNGGTDTATVTITITGENDAPTADDDTAAVDEHDTVNGDLFTNDSDPDTSDVLSVTEIDGNPVTDGEVVTLASGALLTINADGTFTYDPNGAFERLAAGETDTDTFTYTIDDGNGGTDTATVTVTITGENDDPEVTNAALEENVAPDDLVFGNILTDSGATDVDATDVLEISGFSFDGTDYDFTLTDPLTIPTSNGGAITIGSNGDWTFDAVNEAGGDEYVYTITISDGNGGTVDVTLTINTLIA